MVTSDAAAAVEAVGSGECVVLVLPEGESPPRPAGPGRLAVMVGDRTDPAVVEAAGEMHRELFERAG